jgi:glycosyltransferase involved in cell wall biosynthesis
VRESALRVLTFTTLFPNEQQPSHGLFVRERILAMAKLVDLHVVAPIPWFPKVRFLGERYYRYSLVPLRENQGGTPVDHPRFPVIPKVCKAADGLLLAAGSLSRMHKVRDEFPFDLIDSHWAYPDGAAAAILARHFRVPLAITVRGDDINVFLKEFWRRPWIRWALGRADLVIALSSELKDIVAGTGVPASRIAVIPNGINPEAFYPIDCRVARAHLGLPAQDRFVLSVGRLHKSKGYPSLVESVGRLRGRFSDLHLYIVGPPDHEADARPEILQTAARCGLQDRLHLVGAQDPTMLKYWYAAADIFCLPTEREGSANALLEAIACGLPCVTTPVGGNPDAISTGEVGCLVKPDAESMTEAIADALSRPWDRARISELGRRRTWQRVAAECRDRLSAIVDRSVA